MTAQKAILLFLQRGCQGDRGLGAHFRGRDLRVARVGDPGAFGGNRRRDNRRR